MTTIFGRVREDGLVAAATRIDAPIYPVNGWTVDGEFYPLSESDWVAAQRRDGADVKPALDLERSTRYEHAAGIVLTRTDADSIGIEIE